MIITVVRKSLTETVVKNIKTNGCGGINIDKCRIESEDLSLPKYSEGRKAGWRSGENYVGGTDYSLPMTWTPSKGGRFPSNIVLSKSSVKHLHSATQNKDQSEDTVAKYFFIVGD